MKYKYGTFNDNQFSDYIELLHNKIHWLLIYQENSYPKLDNYFNNLQLYIAALAELIPSPYIIDLATTADGKSVYRAIKPLYRRAFGKEYSLDLIEDLDGEEWKPIDRRGKYYISNRGRVKSF